MNKTGRENRGKGAKRETERPLENGGDGVRKPPAGQGTEDVVFDRWLEDRLRNAYSSVLEEPIPDDLLRLLKQTLKD